MKHTILFLVLIFFALLYIHNQSAYPIFFLMKIKMKRFMYAILVLMIL